MSDTQDEFELLASGYIDDELDDDQARRLDVLLAEKPSRKMELDTLKRLAAGTDLLFQIDEPPDGEWDTFLDSVYNRIERRTGWWIFIAGVVALSLLAVAVFVAVPGIPVWIKIVIATPAIGLAILFISVLRNRMHTLKTDRYTREVHR